MPEERVFSEQEVGQIIRRAVQLTEEGASASYKAGVTRAELEKIAGEVGVDAAALQRAILEAGEIKGKRGLLHLTEEFEKVLEGELDPSQFDLLAEGIRIFGTNGNPGMAQVGRSVQMSAWTGVGQAKIDVTSRNGRTKLKVKSNSLFPILMTMHPGLVSTIITVAALGERGLGWLAALIGFAIMTVASFLCAVLVKTNHRKTGKLADHMRERIAESIAEQNPRAELERPATAHAEATPVEQRLLNE